MELFKLLGRIVIDNAEANNEIEETTEKAERSGEGMSSTFKKVGAAVATYFTVDAIRSFGSGCINAAADAEAASSQFTQVFGDLETNASNSLSNIADASGVSENRMKGSFTKIASFAKTTGMDTESALGLSERAMIAVADSAAFYDRSLEDTTESLQSFLKGNYENDAALGLSCTETTRNAAANELYGTSFKDLSEAQKQLTLLKMVEDANAASGALGQAARESDTWSNQTGNLKQAWTDFQAVLGANILPTAVGFVKSLAEFVGNLGEKIPAVVEWFRQYGDVLLLLVTIIGAVVAGIELYNTVAAVQAAMHAAEVTTLGALIAAKLSAAAATAAMYAPYILIAGAIAAVIAIGVALYKNWDVVKEKCAELAAVLREKWEDIKAKIIEVWDSISNYLSTVLNSIMNVVSTIWNSIRNTISTIINAVKNIISTAWNAIKTIIQSVMQIIAGIIKGDWTSVKTAITNILNAIKSVISSIWNGIRSIISSYLDGIKSIISSVFNGVKNTITSIWNGIKSVTTSVWNGIKNAIKTPIEAAANLVKGVIDRIKGFFNFKISWPKIPMPHFGISPSGWSIGDLLKGSIPSLSIQWYKEAMNNPMIMTRPTIFGYDAGTGKLLGGGEAGAEVVSGASTLMSMIQEAVGTQNSSLLVVLYKILEAILTLDANIGGNLREALDGTSLEVNKREFARLVKAVN